MNLRRLGGGAAIAGGVVRIAMAFVVWRPNVAWLEAVAFAIDVLLLFGLMAIYLAQHQSLGGVGLVAFVVAETGIASIVGPDTVAFGIDTYQAGVAVISLGLSLLAIQMLRRRSGSRAAAVLWLSSTVVGLAGGAAGHPGAGFVAGGVLFGLAFATAGASIRR
jgi:hypothetical protein